MVVSVTCLLPQAGLGGPTRLRGTVLAPLVA